MYGIQKAQPATPSQKQPPNFFAGKQSSAPPSRSSSAPAPAVGKPAFNPVQSYGYKPQEGARKAQGINKTERMTFAPGRVQPGGIPGGPQRGPGPARSGPGRTGPAPVRSSGAAPVRSSNPSMASKFPNQKPADKAAIYGFQGVNPAVKQAYTAPRKVQGVNKAERMTFAPGRIQKPVVRGAVSAKSAPNYQASGAADQSTENRPAPSSITYEAHAHDQSTENQPYQSSITYESHAHDQSTENQPYESSISYESHAHDQSTENQPYDSGIGYEEYNPDQSTENQPYDSGISYDQYEPDQSTETYGQETYDQGGYQEEAYGGQEEAYGGQEEAYGDQGYADQGYADQGYQEESYAQEDDWQ